MQPCEEENIEDMKNKMLARIEELKQEMANIRESLHELNDAEIVNFLDNCLDDALYIHELIGEDKEETGGDLRDVLSSKEEEGVENENVKEEVEDKKKTSDESVREEVEEKVRNDEKELEPNEAKTPKESNVATLGNEKDEPSR
nr:hypothetical protein Iba_chr07bCG9060 [Ipomoea batatas]